MRSLTQLVGTTTSTTNQGSFCNLTQNFSSTNVALGKRLVNDHHRYLIQKYFDNEKTYTTITIGGQDIVLGTSPAAGDTSATMSVAWPYSTCQQLVVFGDSEQRTVQFTQNSTSITWQTPLWGAVYNTTASIAAAATTATLSTAWPNATQSLTAYFSDGTSKTVTFTSGSTAISWTGGLTGAVEGWVRTFSTNKTLATQGVQAYPIPANISKISNDTITVGQLVYTPAPIRSIQEWTMVNALPYTSDIPNYYFIYQNQVMFWPIPSTSGNVISFNYKSRVPDMTYDDYSTGTIALTAGSNSVTGTTTSWNTTGTYPLNTDLSYTNLMLVPTPPKGDGFPYPIQRFASDTALTLNLPIVQAPLTSGVSYTIGQYPLLQEDFHDMLTYYACMIYYNSIVRDKSKYEMYKKLYDDKLVLLEAYAGTKSINVDLGPQPTPQNPNLFIFATNAQ